MRKVNVVQVQPPEDGVGLQQLFLFQKVQFSLQRLLIPNRTLPDTKHSAGLLMGTPNQLALYSILGTFNVYIYSFIISSIKTSFAIKNILSSFI